MKMCHHHKDAFFEWAVCRFEESFSELTALCDDDSLVAYALENFGSEKRRCEWLAARILIRKLAGYRAEVLYSPEGKPMLADGSRFLSISHTAGYVAVALHSKCNVGVDVETIGAKVQRLYKRVLGADEVAALDRSNETVAMLLHWSAKESFYKIVGNRGGSYAANFSVSPFMVGESGSFSISYTADGRLIKKLPVTYIVGGDYVFTLCVDEEE